MPALKAIHTTDPRRDILKKVGNISWLRLRVNQILVAIYFRPDEAQFGTLKLKLTDATRQEDKYQGKVGLVIAMGPTAFVSDNETMFRHDDTLQVGDWVVFRASDGWAITLTGDGTDATRTDCRVFVESDIRAVIPHPDLVW